MNRRVTFCLAAVLITAWSASVCSAGDFQPPKEYGNLAKVSKELKRNPKLAKATFERGFTLLHWAAAKGDADVAKLLISKGADVNAQDEWEGYAPIHAAVIENKVELIKLLLSKRANVDAESRGGLTPLMIAATKGYTEAAELLVSHGADVNLWGTTG